MRFNMLAVAVVTAFIVVAHAIAPDAYSMSENTVSQLGSQGYALAWVMRLGFASFGGLLVAGAVVRLRMQPRYWYREVALILYGVGMFLAGVFSAEPFADGVEYSMVEAQLHSIAASVAGAGISFAAMTYALSDQPVQRRLIHAAALVGIVGLSALFGLSSTGAGVVQRLLYVVGFAWLVYMEVGSGTGHPRPTSNSRREER